MFNPLAYVASAVDGISPNDCACACACDGGGGGAGGGSGFDRL